MKDINVSRETIDSDFTAWIDASLKYLNKISKRFRYIFYTDVHNFYNVYGTGYGMKLEYLHSNDKYETARIIDELIKTEIEEGY